jgi:hypothetical protein
VLDLGSARAFEFGGGRVFEFGGCWSEVGGAAADTTTAVAAH